VTSGLEYWRSQHTGPNRGETLPFISADHLRAGQSAFGACLGVDDRHGAGDVVFHGAPGGVLVTVAQRADDELTVVVASRHGRFQRPRHRPGRDRGRRRRRGTARNRRGHPAAGPDSRPEETAAERGITPQDSGRTEAGGGFGGLVLPSGAYVVKGGQVRWVPAVDVTIAMLASLTVVRMLTRARARQRRRRSRP